MENGVILHGLWTGSYFLLWGEGNFNGANYPYQAPPAVFSEMINGTEGEATISVPVTHDGNPVPSSPIMGDVSVKIAGLKEFKVKGIRMTAGEAVKLLTTMEYAAGDDLVFWAKASRFVMSLLSRQRFLPSVSQDGRAQWVLTYNDPSDAERLKTLARAMPLSAAPDAYALNSFLNSAADELIRGWLSESSAVQEWAERLFGDTPASAWYRGLVSNYDQKVDKIKESIDSWVSEIEAQGQGTYRTCFRLDPPDVPGNNWLLQFQLQSVQDPTLMIPAAKAWKDGVARERLLADLGKASRLCRPIETSLRESPEPQAAIMSTDQAYSFLKSDAWLLRESGFGVFVPAMEKSRPKVRVTVKTESTGFFSLRSVARFEWNVAIGDSVISMEEFMKLASLKQQLVYVKGKWVELGDINNIMKVVERYKNGIRIDEAIKLATEGDEYVESVTGEGALKDMLKAIRTKASLEMLPQPAELRASLRQYQLHGYSWLTFMARIGFGAILADDMGLGKTPQAIAFLTGRKGPSLVVVPTSIVGNWKREIERFAPSLTVMVHHGSERLAGKRFMQEAMKHNIVISTYSLLSRDIEDISAVKWDTVVLDEAQNIKNHWTKQAQAARKLTAAFRVALTGTPVENRLSELWSIMDFLNPGYLGSLKEFNTKYAIPVERYGDPEKSEALHRLVEPFIMRRVKTDKSIIQDLPEKRESNILVNLTVEQATLYQGVVDEMMERIASSEGMQRKGLILSTLTRLKQVCDHPSLFLSERGQRLSGRSGKLDRLTEMLEEAVEGGSRALVFTQYVEMGEMLKAHLQSTLGCEVSFLHGGVPRAKRDEMINEFQKEGSGVKVFVISLRAGGLGLNLTGASYVFHYDRWWNPAVEDQATDRAYRIGQRKNVQVYRFIAEGTLEERIDAMMQSKRGLLERVVGESWLTELSTDDLRELLTLREEE